MKKRITKIAKLLNAMWRFMLKAIAFCGKRLVAVLFSRQAAMSALIACIILELVILCIGTTRRLELAYDRSLEVSRAQLAVIEARELAETLPDQGSIIIKMPTASDDSKPSDTAPNLRPRDVDTILAEEADLISAAGDPGRVVLESDEESETEPSKEGDATQNTAKLSADDQEELDRLISEGRKAMIAGDMKRCILHLEEASLLDAEHPAMLYYYGMAYDKLLNPIKAREYYTRVFRLRDRAGIYFTRASRRLTFGFEQTGAMRDKLAFGPHQVEHTYDPESGEEVKILLPVLLAPGEELDPKDLYIQLQFFDLAHGNKIEFHRLATVEESWQDETTEWNGSDKTLLIHFKRPVLTQEEIDAYGDLKYYGFTAKLYYKNDPLDCISTPSALILHEQRLNSRRQTTESYGSGLLPDDGLDNTFEEALPISEFPDDFLPAEP